MLAVYLSTLLFIKNIIIASTWNRKLFQFYGIFVLCVFIMLIYPLESDLKHYYSALKVGIYKAEVGYNILQKILTYYFNEDVSIRLIMITPLLGYAFLLLYSPKGVTYLLGSQLIVLLHLNGVRQGIAVVLIYIGVVLLQRKKYMMGFLIMSSSGLFHSSGYLLSLTILSCLLLAQLRTRTIYIYILFTLGSIFLCSILFDILAQIDLYVAYSVHQEQHSSRTSPVVKYSLLAIYFFYLELLLRKYYRECVWLFYSRYLLFILSITIYLMLGLSEVSARLFIYVFAIEGMIFFTLVSKNIKLKLSTVLFWLMLQLMNPSVFGLIRLAL